MNIWTPYNQRELFGTGQVPVEVRMKRLNWVRENVYIECPFCKSFDNPAIMQQRNQRFRAVCRNTECHQAIDLSTVPLLNKYRGYLEDLPSELFG